MSPGALHAFARTLLLSPLLALAVMSAAARADTGEQIGTELQRLEQRATRLQDVYAIKRLQRAYGYYMDRGLWDEAAALFSRDATFEMGLDGVYIGQARIRAYLYALGEGRRGLSPGQLNEHFQLMPVVDLAADGQHAKGTWRDVMLIGKLGGQALWGEGPFENEYVKEGGIWKISRLHWFQTLLVPYVGGWAVHEDVNGGKFVSDRLPPDAPPSIAYKTWPAAFTPPFHFKGAAPIVADPPVPEPALARASAEELARRTGRLSAQIDRLTDQYQVENLQRIYGYYIDKGQWQQAANLFSDDGEIQVAGRGTYRGKDRVLAYLRAIGPEGLQAGRLFDNMQLQPIVHVADDGRSAQGRWHLFAQLALAGQFHQWSTGVYENTYVKQDGHWKIRRLHVYPTMTTPYEDGWAKTSLPTSGFEPALKPDVADHGPPSTYDHGYVPPFHYGNPVTHPRSLRPGPTAPPEPRLDAIAERLRQAEQQLARAEDVAQIENLQMTYGYYLATLQWDPLADLFSDNGTIEIAMRGVYVGKAAVRRNLNLYGQAGLDNGVLHNHMQYQPVIDVAPDGQSAKLRSRALSMMGNFGKSGMWMGGVYENEFVKLDGVWKFRKDQVMNTYFAPYDVGWKDLAQRAPPGITDSNPPDRPPTMNFDLYPKNFLPPYHYANPVTGER